MWQLLLAAAAAAGSTGLFAKHLFRFRPTDTECQDDETQRQPNPFDDDVKYQASLVSNGLNESECESNCENQQGIFKFSSSGSDPSGFGLRSKNVRKKGVGANKVENERRRGGGGIEVCRRRVAVCLKKRRTSKNVSAKRGSCSSKDSSLFNWGLGVGIMYMMSAGKAEISKLNTAMDETAKVVQELKSELHKRKSSEGLLDFSSADAEKISGKQTQQVLIKLKNGNGDLNDNKVVGFSQVDDGQCSVLTEERDPEVHEMDQLEAELESELQKLPWCTTEASGREDMKLNLHESSEYCQSLGVSPSELKQKLSHLLIQQQENQILDLEFELQSAQSKLNEKEAELQALKDCVKHLTEFSLSTVSDGETAAQEQECSKERDCNNQIEFESMKSVVGMKRPIDTESSNYYLK